MARISAFRSLFALLLAAWMPFCCCTLRSLMSGCVACEGHGETSSAGHHDHGEHHPATAEHEHDDGPAPPQPGTPTHDDGPCTCDKHKQITIGVEKTTIEFATPVLAYVLPEWEPTWSPNA